MVKKPHVKSLRLSDLTVDFIERAEGYTFTEKFENFVYHAVQEEAELDRRLAEKNQQLAEKRRELYEMSRRIDVSDRILHAALASINELEELRRQLEELSRKGSPDG